MTNLRVLAAILSTSVVVLAASAASAQGRPCGPEQAFGWHHQAGNGWRHGAGPGHMGPRSGGPRHMGPQGAGPRSMLRFAAIDEDQDGVVSAEEAAANAEAVFTEMDADEDDALTLEEFTAVRRGPGAGCNPDRQQAMQNRKGDRFKEMDADKDGALSRREFMSAGERRFAASDADQDGKVTPWEFRAAHRRF